MKQLLQIVLLATIALVVLAACSSSSVPNNAPLASNGLYPQPDLSQVGNTGQPQFLNVFANW